MDQLVDGQWLERRLGAPDLRVLDASVAMAFRPEGGFDMASGAAAWRERHIPGSSHADLLGDLSDPDSHLPLMMPSADRFAAAMARLGVGEGTRVVIYDSQMSIWAARLWWMLRAAGHDSAAVLDGGWRGWLADGRPTAGGAGPRPRPARFVVRPRAGMFVGKEDVLAAMDDDACRIVNALQPEAHSGQRKDYARAGHIPGSLNVPFAEILDPETGRYLQPDALRSRFAYVLARRPQRVITYCGKGISACSDAFALALIGRHDVSVYDGSMAEWAEDPALPLEIGPRARRRSRPRPLPRHSDVENHDTASALSRCRACEPIRPAGNFPARARMHRGD